MAKKVVYRLFHQQKEENDKTNNNYSNKKIKNQLFY